MKLRLTYSLLRHHRAERVLLAALLLACAVTLAAQSQFAITPPPGDPQVFLLYLRQAHRLTSGLVQGRSASTAVAIAARLHVEVGNLAVIESVYQSTVSAVEAVDAESRGYVASMGGKRQSADMAKLLGFDKRRTQAIERAKAQLRNALGEPGWLRLRAHLDGEFRLRVKRRGV